MHPSSVHTPFSAHPKPYTCAGSVLTCVCRYAGSVLTDMCVYVCVCPPEPQPVPELHRQLVQLCHVVAGLAPACCSLAPRLERRQRRAPLLPLLPADVLTRGGGYRPRVQRIWGVTREVGKAAGAGSTLARTRTHAHTRAQEHTYACAHTPRHLNPWYGGRGWRYPSWGCHWASSWCVRKE